MRPAVILFTLGLLLYWLPSDIASIRFGLESEPKLALGISLKILMHTLAVLGLFLDKTFGYAFLLGASLQGLLIAYTKLQVVPLSHWASYRNQLWAPGVDVCLRTLSLLFLATRMGRLIGIGDSK